MKKNLVKGGAIQTHLTSPGSTALCLGLLSEQAVELRATMMKGHLGTGSLVKNHLLLGSYLNSEMKGIIMRLKSLSPLVGNVKMSLYVAVSVQNKNKIHFPYPYPKRQKYGFPTFSG